MQYQKIRVLQPVLVIFIVVFGISGQSKGQAAKSSDYKNAPSWVQMMSNPDVNYFEAVKAYEQYWKHHEKPKEEEELLGEGNSDKKGNHEREKERSHGKTTLTQKEIKKLEWKQEMTYQCKRFEDWMRSVKPYIQNDGRILSPEERMKIYDKRQEDLKKDQH